MPKRIFFTVTNDLAYDQRMQRICHSLSEAGYEVTLVGRRLSSSLPLEKKSFRQVRLNCWNTRGKLFYAEYNFRLYRYLLKEQMDAICAIDLDTIIPCLRVATKRSLPAIYDAHELFTEMKEVLGRPFVHKSWLRIEKSTVPRFKYAYTVSESIAEEFRRRYQVNFETIRNLPVLEPLEEIMPREPFILYQGAVNEARKFESLVPAMKTVNAKLVICGDGNFMQKLRTLVNTHGLEHKIELKGLLLPRDLKKIARKAKLGVGLSEREGLNQYLALPNKFLDYIHSGLPQVSMNFPEYRKINDQYRVALLLDHAGPGEISQALNKLLEDDVLYAELKANTLLARNVLNWGNEEKKLVNFYNRIFDL